ncbi:MAG: hypothetical protein WA191_13360 [Telluria sp.]
MESWTDEYDLAPGHCWRQAAITGNARTITYHGALWRPVYTQTEDLADSSKTSRIISAMTKVMAKQVLRHLARSKQWRRRTLLDKIMSCRNGKIIMKNNEICYSRVAFRLAAQYASIIILLGVVTWAKGTGGQEATPTSAWKPTSQQITSVEANLVLPRGAYPLSSYVRYYAGEIANQKRLVKGVFLYKAVPGRLEIVESERLPQVFDGGCSVVNLLYAVDEQRVISIFCQGVG